MNPPTQSPDPWAIHWFRRDLRVAGNAALREAYKTFKGRVLGLFFFDQTFLDRPDFSHDRFIRLWCDHWDRCCAQYNCDGRDLAGPDNATQADTLKLMEIVQKLGLPIESINQAASFFLKRIPDWQNHLILVRSHKQCQIFRPNIELFFKLKLQRASESDLLDLKSMWTLETEKEIFRTRLAAICRSCIESAEQPIKDRVENLRSFIIKET